MNNRLLLPFLSLSIGFWPRGHHIKYTTLSCEDAHEQSLSEVMCGTGVSFFALQKLLPILWCLSTSVFGAMLHDTIVQTELRQRGLRPSSHKVFKHPTPFEFNRSGRYLNTLEGLGLRDLSR